MNLTIKGIPDDVGNALKRLAATSHRSLNGEIIHRLIRSLERPAAEETSARVAESADEVADAWESLAGRWQSDLDVEREIASLYETRTPGRDVDVSW